MSQGVTPPQVLSLHSNCVHNNYGTPREFAPTAYTVTCTDRLYDSARGHRHRGVSFELKRFEEGQRWDGNPKYSTLSWKGIAALIDLLLLKKRLLYRTLTLFTYFLANSTKHETSTRVRQQRHPGTGGTSATHAKEPDRRGASAAQMQFGVP